MQKGILFKSFCEEEALEELNDHLADGWKFVASQDLGSHQDGYSALVIVERDEV